MVDLPTVNRPQVSSVEGPRTAVSPGEVAAPYAELANNLEKIGEGAQQVADTQAEAAGHAAVTRDDQGNPIISKSMLFGQASVAYNRAARYEYLTKVEPDIQNKVDQMRRDFATDPNGFKKASDEYVAGVVKNVRDPLLQGPVERMATQAASSAWRTTAETADRTTRANAFSGLQATIKGMNDQSASLARQAATQGVDLMDLPEYKDLQVNRDAAIRQLASDPRNGYGPERVAEELKASRDADMSQWLVGKTIANYQTKGNAVEAKRWIMDQMWGEGSDKYRLSPHQRDAVVTESLKGLDNISAEDRAAVAENKATVEKYIANAEATGNVDPGALNNHIGRSVALKDFKSENDLRALQANQGLNKWVKGANMQEGAAALHAINRDIIPDYASPMDVWRSIFQQETGSGANTSTSWAGAQGPGQIIPETFARFKQGNERIDNYDDNIRVSQRMIATFHQMYGGDAKRIAVAYYSGEGNVAPPGSPTPWKVNKQPINPRTGKPDPSVSEYVAQVTGRLGREIPEMTPGTPMAMQTQAAQKLFQSTAAKLREQVSGQAVKAGDAIVDTLNKGGELGPSELEDFGTAVVESGRQDLLPKVQEALDAAETAKKVAPGTQAAFKSMLEQVLASGPDPLRRRMAQQVQQDIETNNKRYATSPMSAAVVNRQVTAINQLDLARPDQVGAELKDRDNKMKYIRQQRPDVPAASPVIDGIEADVIGNQIKTGDPDTTAAFFKQAEMNLSPEVYNATMAQPGMKDALVTAANSSNPKIMVNALQTLDRLWRGNAPAFKETYGAQTFTRMMAWEGLKDAYTPEQIALRLNKADDPAEAKSRQDTADAVDKEFKDLKDQQVADKFGNWFQRNFPYLHADVSQGPNEAPQAGVLRHQYEDLVKSMRIYGVPADKASDLAVTQLQKEWGVSSLTGKLMKNRPDDPNGYYKPIGGSYEWMAQDLHDLVASVYGRQTIEAGTAGTSPNWEIEAIVPDKQTQAEIAAAAAHQTTPDGKPIVPKYQIAVTRNGMTDFLVDKNGKTRFGWDRTDAEKRYVPGFEGRQITLGKLRQALPGDAGAFP
jgi:hypothetical protein